MKITEDALEQSMESFYDLVRKSIAEATRNGIKANSIVINRNMVRVPEQFGQWPEMICGLHCYFTANELPDGYTFSVQHAPRHEPVQTGWIPVTERLPESKKSVFVSVKDKTFGHRHTLIAAHIGWQEATTEDYGWQEYEGDTEYDEEHD